MNPKLSIVLSSLMAIVVQGQQAIVEETSIVNNVQDFNYKTKNYSENRRDNSTEGKPSNNSVHQKLDKNLTDQSHNITNIDSDYNEVKEASLNANNYKSNGYSAKEIGNNYENSTHYLKKENNLNFTILEEKTILNKSDLYHGDEYETNDSDILQDDVISNETLFEWKRSQDAYEITTPEKFPYAVLLMVQKQSRFEGFCSGSILSEEWVLTAAHCLKDFDNVIVYAGGNSAMEYFYHLDTKVPLPKTVQVLQSTELIMHPLYSDNPHDCDVGLVKVKERFTMTETVNTIKLATKPWKYHSYISCYLTGFGVIQMGEFRRDDNHRKTHNLDVKNPCLCSFRLQIKFGVDVASRYICTRPEKDYGVCPGDSGGGLVCEGNVHAVATLLVALKDTDLCDFSLTDPMQCGGTNTLSIFLETCPFLPWINQHVKLFKASEISPDCVYKGGSTRFANNLDLFLVSSVVILIQQFQ